MIALRGWQRHTFGVGGAPDHGSCAGWTVHKTVLRAILAAVMLAAALSGSLSAVHAQDKSRTDAQRRLEKNRTNFQRTQERIKAISTDVDAITAEREQLNKRLLETGRLVQMTETRMTELEGRIDALGKRRDGLRARLRVQNHSIVKLLGAMQRMGRDPPPVIVTQRSDALKMVRSAMLLAKAFPDLKDKADAITAQLRTLVRVLAEHQRETQRLKQEAVRLNQTKTQLAELMETKRQSLIERRKELEELKRTANLLSKNVADLSELIARLDRAVAEKTRLGSYNANVPREQEKPPAIAIDPNVKPRGPSTVEIAPRPGTRTASAGRLEPVVPFYKAKATLPLPASGQTILNFGDRTQYGAHSKGLVIKTRHQAQITSPCDGWVVYAGEFRSYGQLLIINAGAGYHVLLAGLSRIDVQLGQFVLAAEPVGSMPAAPRSGSADNAPVLYVEFRKDGKPIDPGPWWAKGQQKVQG